MTDNARTPDETLMHAEAAEAAEVARRFAPDRPPHLQKVTSTR